MNNELLKKLDNARRGLCTENPKDYMAVGLTVADALEAAARIRELEAERDEAVTQMVEAKIERDKAQDRVRLYRAMIRAAQPDKPQQGE